MKEALEIHLKKINNSAAKRLFLNRPILKMIILLIISLVLINIQKSLPEVPIKLTFILIYFLIVFYFIVALVFIVKERINYLMNPKNIFKLIQAYAILILVIITVFSMLFSAVEFAQMGYITYGVCSDKFSPASIISDSQISQSYFYFTAVTFFSVGYGDICPMGWAKILAVITAFAGNVISVILIAVILNNYLRHKEKAQ
jgi:potassium channel LctB